MNEIKQDVAQSVESGEYYRDALRWYGTLYHAPISHRALLIIITGIALLITFLAMIGLFMLTPLKETKPMIVRVSDSLDRVARVEALMEGPLDDADAAVMQWFIRDFIKARESYDVDKQQTMFIRVRELSVPQVLHDYFALYRSTMSPTIRYERHTKRMIKVRDVAIRDVVEIEEASGSTPAVTNVKAQVRFVATEQTPTEDRNSIWLADIAFRFSKIHVDQLTGAITPMEFKVTGYESKQLGLE